VAIQQQIPQQQQQPQFQPSLTQEQTRSYISLYKRNPRLFDENKLNQLREHANYHNVPFYEGDFSIIEALKQAGGGFIEGFTTLNIIDPPDNEWEAVARSAGHLAGFAPGILAGPMSKIKALQGAASALRGARGLPLKIAEDFITPQVKKFTKAALRTNFKGKTDAFDTVSKFLTTGKAAHIAEGAFNLGTASAISSWQGGVDSMLDSFFHGAVAGGVFRGIGNQINLKDPKAEKFARGLAGSLFMGLPSTIRGASTPEQVYEYYGERVPLHVKEKEG